MRRALLLVLPLLHGCAVTEISPAGAAVEVGTGERADCQFLGTIHASEGANARTPETNIEAVQASLRNQAADRGANRIVITSQQLGTGMGSTLIIPAKTPIVTGGCPNCISMAASVYKCGGGSGPVRVSDQAPAAAPARPAAAPTPAAAPASRPEEFSLGDAKAALEAAAESAHECRPAGGPRGSAAVKVTFAMSGDVVFVDVLGAPFAGTPIADCITRAFRKAHVPAFVGGSVSASKTVVFE
jgi:hypothetical protein